MDIRRLNLAELDKDLSEEERREWNSIYASYRGGSLLTGTVSGLETKTVKVKNSETGKYEERILRYLVVIDYRVKVVIRRLRTALWAAGFRLRSSFILCREIRHTKKLLTAEF